MGGQAQTFVANDGVKYELCNNVCQAVGVEENKLPSDGVITILKSVNIEGTDYDVTRIAGGQDDKLSDKKGDEFGAFGGSSEAPCDKVKGVKFADGSEVTKIGDHAFRFCTNLLSIENLPATLTEIGGYCFEASQLNGIDLSQTGLTTLPDGCFYNCSKLEGIVMPNKTLTYLGEKAFYGNTSLKSIDLTNSSFDILRNGTFEGCSSLSNVVLPLSLKNIWGTVFKNCTSLRNIIFPDGIYGIYEHAFDNTGLESVVIPGSVGSFGEGTFYNCSKLQTVVNNSKAELTYLLFRDSAIKDLYITSSEAVKMKAWYFVADGATLHVTPSLVETYENALQEKGMKDCTVNSDFPITLGSDYATFSSAFNLDFSAAEGLIAYKGGVDADKSTVTLTQVSKVPANNGVVLKGEAGRTYTAKILDPENIDFSDNQIQASVDGTYLTQSTDYVLSKVDGIYAFRPISKLGYLRPGVAYLPLPDGASAKVLSFAFDNTPTGISSITTVNAQNEGAYYTLDGVKMSKPAKGFYIHNGKKYFNK